MQARWYVVVGIWKREVTEGQPVQENFADMDLSSFLMAGDKGEKNKEMPESTQV